MKKTLLNVTHNANLFFLVLANLAQNYYHEDSEKEFPSSSNFCFRVFPSVSECFRVFPSVSERFRVFPSFSNFGFRVFPSVSECFRAFPSVSKF